MYNQTATPSFMNIRNIAFCLTVATSVLLPNAGFAVSPNDLKILKSDRKVLNSGVWTGEVTSVNQVNAPDYVRGCPPIPADPNPASSLKLSIGSRSQIDRSGYIFYSNIRFNSARNFIGQAQVSKGNVSFVSQEESKLSPILAKEKKDGLGCGFVSLIELTGKGLTRQFTLSHDYVCAGVESKIFTKNFTKIPALTLDCGGYEYSGVAKLTKKN